MIERVVIVDDEEGILSLLRRVLRAPGREVEVFPSPESALEAMRRTRPDVVLTDLHMPGMSGTEFIRAIREEFGARMGIIVVTAFPTLVSDADAVADGIGAYLRKPFTDLDLLRSTVAEVIESTRRAPEADLSQPMRRHLAAADCVRRQQRASLSRADAVLDQISDAIFVADRWGRLLQLNPAAARLLGTSAEECLGRRLSELEVDASLRAAVLEPGGGTEGGVCARRVVVESSGRSYDVTTAPLVNAVGARAGVLSVVEDVTAEVRVQELKHHYLTVLAHELRTPLTALQSFSACFELAGTPLEPRRQELVVLMREQLLRLEHQVDRLILLARLERGDFTAPAEPFAVGPAIADALESCQHLAREKGVACVVGPVEIGLVASGDVDDFRRALHEIGENAVKFTAAGGSVRVSAEARGDEVVVRVADTGIGIDPRDQAAIFTEFRQLEDPLTRSHPGAGLGLSLARRMIEAIGGRVTLQSAPERGSTFTLHLPKPVRQEVARPGAQDASSSGSVVVGRRVAEPCPIPS
jgi:PAS domain S-box-containing protein